MYTRTTAAHTRTQHPRIHTHVHHTPTPYIDTHTVLGTPGLPLSGPRPRESCRFPPSADPDHRLAPGTTSDLDTSSPRHSNNIYSGSDRVPRDPSPSVSYPRGPSPPEVRSPSRFWCPSLSRPSPAEVRSPTGFSCPSLSRRVNLEPRVPRWALPLAPLRHRRGRFRRVSDHRPGVVPCQDP